MHFFHEIERGKGRGLTTHFFFVGWEFQPAELPLPVAALYGRVFPSILKSTIFRLFALVLPRRLMPVCSVSFLCVVCFQCIFLVPLSAYDFWALILSKASF